MRRLAKSKSLKLNEYGLFYADNTKLPGINQEQDIFAALGQKYVQPEARR
ncbi:hypothetical protein [Nitrosococcus watsonii]